MFILSVHLYFITHAVSRKHDIAQVLTHIDRAENSSSTLVVELQLEGIEEVRERYQAVNGIFNQSNSTRQEKRTPALSNS